MFNSEGKKLVVSVSTLLVVALCLSILFDLVYRTVTHNGYNFPSHLLINKEITNKYQIVKVGNSHAEDSLTFEKYNARSLDLAGVAQRFSYDMVLLKQHRKEIEDNALIIISVSPISFSHKIADASDGLQYNYYGTVSPFLIPNLKVGDYIQQEFVPFLRSGYLFRKWYTDKVEERISEEERWKEPEQQQLEVVVPPQAPTKGPILNIDPEEIPYNVEAILAELNSPSPISKERYIDNMNFIFNKWYHTEEFDPKYFEINRRDLEKLIAYCKKNNWRPVLITIPISAVLQEGLLDDYMGKYLYENMDKTDLQGAEYIDFSNQLNVSTNNYLYSNADHLNKRGGAIFSYILMNTLIERGYLPPEIDNYDYRPLYKVE